MHDFLTGLPNREYAYDAGQVMSTMAAGMSVLMINLDGFKLVNDTLGHQSGTSC